MKVFHGVRYIGRNRHSERLIRLLSIAPTIKISKSKNLDPLTSLNPKPHLPMLFSDGAHRRDQIAEKMTPDQIAEAQRLAKEWKPK